MPLGADPPRRQVPLTLTGGRQCDTEGMAGLRENAAALRGGISLGHRAAQLGHLVGVEREGNRFRVVCECGWSTRLNSTRKAAFADAVQHTVDVVKAAS